MTIFTLIIAVFILSDIVSAICAISKVIKTSLLTRRQKAINIVLVIVIPLFWSLLLYYMLKKEPVGYDAEVKNKVSSNGFYAALGMAADTGLRA